MRENRGLLLVALLLLVIAGLLAAPTDTGRPLDPRSTGNVGFAAGVRLLEGLGAQVRMVDAPGGPDETVIVTRAALDDEQVDRLRTHVRDGGRAIVFDPDLAFVEVEPIDRIVTNQFGPTVVRGTCPRLDGYVDEVASADWIVLAEGVDGENCLPVGAGVGLRVVDVGEGDVVVLGAASVFTNDAIGDRDHARLLTALALPDGPGPVVVLDDRLPGTVDDEQSILALVTPRFWAPAGLLLAGLLVLGWSRARRLERPVEEDLAVRVPGSELVLAIGDLLERHGHRDAAATRLREDLRRQLAGQLELPRDTEAATVADLLRSRAPDVDDADLRLALGNAPVADDQELTRIGSAVARIRRALDHQR